MSGFRRMRCTGRRTFVGDTQAYWTQKGVSRGSKSTRPTLFLTLRILTLENRDELKTAETLTSQRGNTMPAPRTRTKEAQVAHGMMRSRVMEQNV